MNNEVWQQLFSLENRDLTCKWFKRIHSRELNAQRTHEINAAAKQAREYFRNASNSHYSVRPLLTFYGVASLSRSLLLLLSNSGGEATLKAGHGLGTVDWHSFMSGDVTAGLQNLRYLKIRTQAGLFSDFVEATANRISIHVNSSAVDGRLSYNIPAHPQELSFDDLLSRIPDLQKDYLNISDVVRYAPINEMTYTKEAGFRAVVKADEFSQFQTIYESLGYTLVPNAESTFIILTCDTKTFENNLPMFIHTYVNKMFGSIPSLHLAEPFPANVIYSQLCVTYMVSYILGMLVRYYPTHWMSLIQGHKGDSLWPTMNRAQHLVEQTFPELVIELLSDVLTESSTREM